MTLKHTECVHYFTSVCSYLQLKLSTWYFSWRKWQKKNQEPRQNCSIY